MVPFDSAEEGGGGAKSVKDDSVPNEEGGVKKGRAALEDDSVKHNKHSEVDANSTAPARQSKVGKQQTSLAHVRLKTFFEEEGLNDQVTAANTKMNVLIQKKCSEQPGYLENLAREQLGETNSKDSLAEGGGVDLGKLAARQNRDKSKDSSTSSDERSERRPSKILGLTTGITSSGILKKASGILKKGNKSSRDADGKPSGRVEREPGSDDTMIGNAKSAKSSNNRRHNKHRHTFCGSTDLGRMDLPRRSSLEDGADDRMVRKPLSKTDSMLPGGSAGVPASGDSLRLFGGRNIIRSVMIGANEIKEVEKMDHSVFSPGLPFPLEELEMEKGGCCSRNIWNNELVQLLPAGRVLCPYTGEILRFNVVYFCETKNGVSPSLLNTMPEVFREKNLSKSIWTDMFLRLRDVQYHCKRNFAQNLQLTLRSSIGREKRNTNQNLAWSKAMNQWLDEFNAFLASIGARVLLKSKRKEITGRTGGSSSESLLDTTNDDGVGDSGVPNEKTRRRAVVLRWFCFALSPEHISEMVDYEPRQEGDVLLWQAKYISCPPFPETWKET